MHSISNQFQCLPDSIPAQQKEEQQSQQQQKLVKFLKIAFALSISWGIEKHCTFS